jgi:hypothetical protein
MEQPPRPKRKPAGGRYGAGHPDTVRRLRAEGWKNQAIADFFRVSTGALKVWKIRYPRFRAAWNGEPDPGGGKSDLQVDAPEVSNAQRRRDLVELARKYVPEAVETLRDIMRNPDSPAAARISAATTLIERAEGKAPQTIEHTGAGGGPVKYELTEEDRALLAEARAGLRDPVPGPAPLMSNGTGNGATKH